MRSAFWRFDAILTFLAPYWACPEGLQVNIPRQNSSVSSRLLSARWSFSLCITASNGLSSPIAGEGSGLKSRGLIADAVFW